MPPQSMNMKQNRILKLSLSIGEMLRLLQSIPSCFCSRLVTYKIEEPKADDMKMFDATFVPVPTSLLNAIITKKGNRVKIKIRNVITDPEDDFFSRDVIRKINIVQEKL